FVVDSATPTAIALQFKLPLDKLVRVTPVPATRFAGVPEALLVFHASRDAPSVCSGVFPPAARSRDATPGGASSNSDFGGQVSPIGRIRRGLRAPGPRNTSRQSKNRVEEIPSSVSPISWNGTCWSHRYESNHRSASCPRCLRRQWENKVKKLILLPFA